MTTLADINNDETLFEEIEVGSRFVTPGRTVTEADIVAFAGLSGDYNSIHIDFDFAKQTAHGQRIAHGLLVLAIISGLSTRTALMKRIDKTLIALADLECRFKRPTFIGDTLRAELELVEKRPSKKEDRGILVFRRAATNQRGETVLESRLSFVVKRVDRKI